MQLFQLLAASLALLPSLAMAAPGTNDKRYLDTVQGNCWQYDPSGNRLDLPFCYSQKYVQRQCPTSVCNSCTLSSDGSVACW